jgi:DNA/RNA-binding protein KIN17
VKWVGRERRCAVDETEKSLYIQYVDGDLETIAILETRAHNSKVDRDDQEKIMEFIEKQIEREEEYSHFTACNVTK